VRAPAPAPAHKQQLARLVVDRLGTWTLEYAASFLDTDIARVSNLRNGRLQPFSLQQLIRFVARAKGEVTIAITWKPYFLYMRKRDWRG
jgi:predicted XRE-type DNA-binding protein